jgi:hypothetical protein
MLDWADELLRAPRVLRTSAEDPERAERQRLLEEVALNGFVTTYTGVRVSRIGRRFSQRAMLPHWRDAAGHAEAP